MHDKAIEIIIPREYEYARFIEKLKIYVIWPQRSDRVEFLVGYMCIMFLILLLYGIHSILQMLIITKAPMLTTIYLIFHLIILPISAILFIVSYISLGVSRLHELSLKINLIRIPLLFFKVKLAIFINMN